MNDLKGVRPGAAVVHDATYSMADARDDVFYYPVPFTQLAKTRIENDKLRKQLEVKEKGGHDENGRPGK